MTAAARHAVLERAASAVSGDRDQSYGAPEDSFAVINQMWDALDRARGPRPRTGQDVALMLAALKLARCAANPGHQDSWDDLAGYAACGGSMVNAPGEVAA